jgi:hypothetical protein
VIEAGNFRRKFLREMIDSRWDFPALKIQIFIVLICECLKSSPDFHQRNIKF